MDRNPGIARKLSDRLATSFDAPTLGLPLPKMRKSNDEPATDSGLARRPSSPRRWSTGSGQGRRADGLPGRVRVDAPIAFRVGSGSMRRWPIVPSSGFPRFIAPMAYRVGSARFVASLAYHVRASGSGSGQGQGQGQGRRAIARFKVRLPGRVRVRVRVRVDAPMAYRSVVRVSEVHRADGLPGRVGALRRVTGLPRPGFRVGSESGSGQARVRVRVKVKVGAPLRGSRSGFRVGSESGSGSGSMRRWPIVPSSGFPRFIAPMAYRVGSARFVASLAYHVRASGSGQSQARVRLGSGSGSRSGSARHCEVQGQASGSGQSQGQGQGRCADGLSFRRPGFRGSSRRWPTGSGRRASSRHWPTTSGLPGRVRVRLGSGSGQGQAQGPGRRAIARFKVRLPGRVRVRVRVRVGSGSARRPSARARVDHADQGCQGSGRWPSSSFANGP